MTDQNQNKTNVTVIVVMVILGVIAVFATGIILGNILGSSEATPPPVTMPTPAPGVPSAEAASYVNVRTGPSTQFPILGIAPPGSIAEIIGKSEDGGWWVVRLPTSLVGAGQGWVSAEVVKASNGENVPVVASPPLNEIDIPAPEPGVPTAETLDAVNVRSGPGTTFPAYGVAPQGMRLEVIGKSEDGGWWVVKIPTQYVGTGQGWVSDDFVKTTNAGGVPVIPAPPQ